MSELNGKVVDIERGSEDEGAHVIMWEKGHEKQPNQLWYLDSLGNIRSSLNNMVFYSKSELACDVNLFSVFNWLIFVLYKLSILRITSFLTSLHSTKYQ